MEPAIVTIDHDCECDLRHPGGEVIGRELVTRRACRWSAISGNISANKQTGGAMTADRTKTGPEPSNAQPGGDAADGRNDDVSQPSMAELSRRLGERAARQRAVDPAAAKAARRAALEAYDQAQERRLIVGSSVAVAAVIGAGIVYLVSTVGSGPVPQSPSAAARSEPASPPERTAAAPAPDPLDTASPSPAPSSPSAAASVADTPAVVPAAAQTEPAPVTGSQQGPVEPAPNQAALRRDEMREVQARLRSFGFNPGPVDGVPGLMTEDAVQHYQRHRGQRQTGTVDRELLEQLRQDPAPQVAQPAAQPDARVARSPRPRRADPFEPVRAAGERFGQWLHSLTR
jgi:Putative peptidoglycan binding domain